MEWNAKPPLLWDWDSQAGSFSSEFGNCSSARTTVSPSVDDSGFRVLTETGPKDLPAGLKAVKRNYLDRDSGENSEEKRNTVGVVAGRAVRKTKISEQNCQVEGCSDDLSTAKDYHRKHRVCPEHSKCSRVIVAGLERRFCQQCSRFQALSEFDEKKRSCRKRLSNHNSRRRKPQPEIISFNSAVFSPADYANRQINFLWNKAPMISNASSAWQSSYDQSLTLEKGPWPATTKGLDVSSVHFPSLQLSNGSATRSHEIMAQFPLKVHQGSRAPIVASNLDGAPDIRPARSLLSAGSWVSLQPRQTTSFTPIAKANNDDISAQLMIQSVNSTSDYWQDRKPQPKQARHFPFHLEDSGSRLDRAPPF